MNDLPNLFQARPIEPQTADAYFAHVESLEAAQIRAARRWRTAAWTVAGGACAVAVAACLALAELAPLHTVEWRLVRVDSTTGVVDEVSSLRDAPKDVNEATARYFVGRYVEARESYIPQEVQHDFRTVSLMSAPDEQRRYAGQVNASNKESPQVRLGKRGFIRAHINSVSILSPTLAQARVTLEEHDGGVDAPKVSHVIASMAYEWRPDARMTNADRQVNPLGFLVTEYHTDPETP